MASAQIQPAVLAFRTRAVRHPHSPVPSYRSPGITTRVRVPWSFVPECSCSVRFSQSIRRLLFVKETWRLQPSTRHVSKFASDAVRPVLKFVTLYHLSNVPFFTRRTSAHCPRTFEVSSPRIFLLRDTFQFGHRRFFIPLSTLEGTQ